MTKVKTTVFEVEQAIKLGQEIMKYPLSKKEVKQYIKWDQELTETMNQVVLDWKYQEKLDNIAKDIKKKYEGLEKQQKLMNEKKLPKKVVDEIQAKLREKELETKRLSDELRIEFQKHEVEVPVCVIDYPDHQPSGVVMIMERSPMFNLK